MTVIVEGTSFDPDLATTRLHPTSSAVSEPTVRNIDLSTGANVQTNAAVRKAAAADESGTGSGAEDRAIAEAIKSTVYDRKRTVGIDCVAFREASVGKKRTFLEVQV
jgi:hypothetical protein